jgi:accessory colonization factor AcfC
MSVQFALALTLKGKVNYLDVDIKLAHLRKSILIVGKMNPYFIIKNDSWKYESQPVR